MDKHKLNEDSAATKVWQYVHWYHCDFTFCPWLPQAPWLKGTWSCNDKRYNGKLQAGKIEIFWQSTIKSWESSWENRKSGSQKQSQWGYWNSQYWNPTNVICDWESKEEFRWNWISCWEKDSHRLVLWYGVIFNSFSDIKPFHFVLKFSENLNFFLKKYDFYFELIFFRWHQSWHQNQVH